MAESKHSESEEVASALTDLASVRQAQVKRARVILFCLQA